MPYSKTLFTPGQLPALDAAEANRMGHGIKDLFDRKLVIAINGLTTYTFAGLDGDSEGPYRLTLDGRIAAGGADRNVRALLRGPADNSDNSRNVGIEMYVNGDDSNTAPALTKPSPDSGLWIGQVRWTVDCDINSEAVIACNSARRPTHKVECSTKPNVGDPRIMHTTLSGFLYTPRPVTSMILDFNGAAFTGRAILEKLGLS